MTMVVPTASRGSHAIPAFVFTLLGLIVSVSAFVADKAVLQPAPSLLFKKNIFAASTQPTIFQRRHEEEKKKATILFSTAESNWSTAVMPRISSSDLQELATKGVVVIKDFISPELQRSLRQDVQELRQTHSKFNIAKIGQDSANALNKEIRVAGM